MSTHKTSAILQELEYNAVARADKIAFSDGELRLSWAGVYRAARALAAQWCGEIQPGQAVAVLSPRQASTPVLFFAVLLCGGFYLPLDPDMPAARAALVFENADIRLAVGCGARPGLLPGQVAWQGCDMDAFTAAPQLNAQQETLLAARRATVTGESPLYLVYTSGSTGVPKGVCKQHSAMESFVTAFLQEYPIKEEDVLGNQTPFFFDASAKDLYWCLRTGCRLEILPTRLFSFPIELIRAMNDAGVTMVSWVPSALAMVTQLDAFSCILPTSLRAVFFVGEVFPPKQLARWQAALPQLLYVNLYGSSELAGVCCHCKIGPDIPVDKPLPLGSAFANCDIALMDGEVPVTEPGVEGELCISGPSLALGYYNDPVRTQSTFRQENGRRVLHTGDMAMYNGVGQLVYTSRRDHQIKHMGYRIELGEIEAAASALEGVEISACVYDENKGRIILFVQPVAGAEIQPALLTAQLKERLCSYMTPQRIHILPALPRNANGKVDRVALKQQATAPRVRPGRREKTE